MINNTEQDHSPDAPVADAPFARVMVVVRLKVPNNTRFILCQLMEV